ncbi:MAG TPA: hypothetical protein VFS07_05360 [Gemmatimonadales bacterium]|nr:hypothetical protein [Gemmatimonadales bacterium]
MVRAALVLGLCGLAPAALHAQADTAGPGLRLAFPLTLPRLRIPPAHLLAGGEARRAPEAVAAAWAARTETALDSARGARAEAALLRALYGQRGGAAPGEAEEGRGVLGLGRQYADLSIDGSAQVEMRTDRLKNERCLPYQLQDPASGCQGRFTPPRIDNLFAIRAGGVVGRRLNIDVDYDSRRDFNANNDIRVFYQGLEDEIVQRVEFGTVTFAPPPSRFITAAIPAYSFGLSSQLEFGPVRLGALAASQKGSAVTERQYQIGSTTSVPQDRRLRDLDFEQGRFFWVVDPATIPGYPALDILDLPAGSVPDADRPAQVRLYRYRPSTGGGVTPGLGGITAVGYRPDSDQRTGRVQWQLLVEGQDYVVDPSGLWVALANRLDQNDYLAVSYRTATGALVGSFPAVDDPAASDSVLLVLEPRRDADVPTFRYEMRQVYRVAGTDLDRASLKVGITLNQTERPVSGAATYLAQLGLAVPSDPAVLDVDNRVFPRTRDALAAQVMRESYIVFPTLVPFADPARLTPAERTDSLYRTPLYLLYTQGPPSRFQLRLRYNAASGGDRSVLDLNAFQIRPGSETVIANGQTLERGTDYSISYDLGQVTFLDPDGLFGDRPGNVTVRFEERGIFAVAPTTIYGLTSTYTVGEAGTFNLIGIYQQENTVFNRPPVGFEPSANLVGGLTGDFRFRPAGVTRLMSSLVSGGTEAPSTLDLKGEVAFTAPQANRAGAAYLEEFEGTTGLELNLRENAWGFGSRPERADGVEGLGFVAGFDSADAVQLTWQNLILGPNGTAVEVRTRDIDSLVRLSGGADPVEKVLYVTLHADTAGGFVRRDNSSSWTLPERPDRPRWRSFVTPLSTTGIDLTQDEYLEFWLFEGASASADSAHVALVMDLGTVNEDGLFIAPESLSVSGADSTWGGRRYSGVGRLDTEREPTGVFNASLDDIGIGVDRPDTLVVNGAVTLDTPTCGQELTNAVPLYRWGDLGVRCTRGNGTMDTEDLNGDNVLNATGPGDNVFRWVVDLRDPKYFVRTGGTGWRLYRIPLRNWDAQIGTPNARLVQHLRITVAAGSDNGLPDIVGRFALARMRFLGAPWVRRSDAPVLGLSGATAEPHGEVVVSTVSTENRELGYVPPPGVVSEAARQDATRGQSINEHSLRLLGRDLRPGERAEGYFRFLAGPQNMLKYRQIRLWARGRGEGWDDGRLQAVFKVASDERNFYAYRVGAATDTWRPEVVIDLDAWRALRADIESRWLRGEAPSGAAACGAGDSTAYVACQGPYLVQVADPGINPPNLAAVQEIDAAVYYAGAGAALAEAELWVDDIRLTDPVNAVGTATALSARLAAADVADLNFSYIRQDGDFQQLGQSPTFRTTAAAQAGATVRMDRFLPRSLGVLAPVSVAYTRSTVDPELVTGTDLRGSDLPELRRPEAHSWSVGMSLRRSARGRGWLMQGLVDPFSLSASLSGGRSRTELSDAALSTYNVQASYVLQSGRHGPHLPLEGLAAALPDWLEQSPLGRGLVGQKLALAPTSVRFSSGLARSENRFTSYSVPVARAADSLLVPTLNLTHTWRNTAGLTFQPLGMLTFDGNLSSTRDLRVYADSTPLGRLAGQERRELLGLDVGVERDRLLSTNTQLAPRVASWLRPRFIRTSSFTLTRSLTSRDPVRVDGDSGAFVLPQGYANARLHELGLSTDLSQLAAIVGGSQSGLAKALARVRPLDLTFRRGWNSTYDLATFEPSLGFMLATGSQGDFLAQGDQSALSAGTTDERRVSGGADLPGGLSLAATYGIVSSRRFARAPAGFNEVLADQVDWPSGNVTWNRVIRDGPLTLVRIGASAKRRTGTTETPSSTGTLKARTVSDNLTPDLTLTFRNGMVAGLNWNRTLLVNETNGNHNENRTDLWTATMSQAFRLPQSLSASRLPMRASLTGQDLRTRSCLRTASAPEAGCRIVADVRRLTLTGGLTSDIASTTQAGLNVQYVSNEVIHLSQKTTQLSIVASLTIQLSSGNFR